MNFIFLPLNWEEFDFRNDIFVLNSNKNKPKIKTIMIDPIFWLVPASSVVALFFAWFFFKQMMKESEGTDTMKKIAKHVRDGAMAYLRQQYKVVGIVFVIITILFVIMAYVLEIQNPWVPFAFLTGGFFSGLAGFFGMRTATYASARTANAAQRSLNDGLRIAFRSGAVMGLVVVGLGLLDISVWFYALQFIIGSLDSVTDGIIAVDPSMKLIIITTTTLTFGMGASTQALFARVGGGIFTKAADVGADLVGKLEAGIPEDDPRNPATIADNVGDNVGDVAGMGADLFGSYVATVLATMILGRETISIDRFGGMAPILLPMLIAAMGILFSIVATFFVKISESAPLNTTAVQKALNMGNWGSIILSAIASYFLVMWLLPDTMVLRNFHFTKNGVFGAIAVGLAVGTL